MKLRDAIQHEIATGCYRKVNRRLALKLASALERGEDADIYFASVLAGRLNERLKWRLELISRRGY